MYTYTYIHSHIYTDIYTHITHAHIHTYISIHRCTCAHDYAHVHAIVKMQSKMHAHKCLCEQPHAHIYAHTNMYALLLSPICMLFLVMSQLRICLQVTVIVKLGNCCALKLEKATKVLFTGFFSYYLSPKLPHGQECIKAQAYG